MNTEDKSKLHELSIEIAALRNRVSTMEKREKKIQELELNYEKIAYINKGVNLFRRLFDMEIEMKKSIAKQDKFIITMHEQLKTITENFKYLENKIRAQKK